MPEQPIQYGRVPETMVKDYKEIFGSGSYGAMSWMIHFPSWNR
jgi:hypothetical protein